MEQNGTSYTMLLGPIGRDRRDSIRFSITETELTILESALGDGHGEVHIFVDASDRVTRRVHYFHGPRSKRVEGLDTSWIHRVFLGRITDERLCSKSHHLWWERVWNMGTTASWMYRGDTRPDNPHRGALSLCTPISARGARGRRAHRRARTIAP